MKSWKRYFAVSISGSDAEVVNGLVDRLQNPVEVIPGAAECHAEVTIAVAADDLVTRRDREIRAWCELQLDQSPIGSHADLVEGGRRIMCPQGRPHRWQDEHAAI